MCIFHQRHYRINSRRDAGVQKAIREQDRPHTQHQGKASLGRGSDYRGQDERRTNCKRHRNP